MLSNKELEGIRKRNNVDLYGRSAHDDIISLLERIEEQQEAIRGAHHIASIAGQRIRELEASNDALVRAIKREGIACRCCKYGHVHDAPVPCCHCGDNHSGFQFDVRFPERRVWRNNLLRRLLQYRRPIKNRQGRQR